MSLEVNVNDYVSPATQNYLLAGTIGAFGIYCLGIGYWNHGAYVHTITSTPNPKSKTDIKKLLDSRGMHRSGVYIKLSGTAEAGSSGKLVKAPLRLLRSVDLISWPALNSGFDCVFVRTSYLGNRVRLSSDIQAHEREEVQEVPWGLKLSDDSRIGVITSGADLSIDGTVREKFISESVIQNHSSILVLGWIKEATPNVYTISKPMIRWFLITTRSEEELVQDYRKWWYIYSTVGVVALIVGGWKALEALHGTAAHILTCTA